MRRGIDVSTYQKAIDWTKVRTDGVKFAMIKATQGKSETNPSLYLFTDSRFKYNIENAYKNGIECGVYHYLTATTPAGAREEAEYFLKTIEPYKGNIKLYAAVDVESPYLPNDKTLLTQIVNLFCVIVKQAGYDPMVYTNQNFLTYRLNGIFTWKLWLALWRDKENVPTAEQYPNLAFWQWGSETVKGIATGNVDANFEITAKAKPAEPKPAEPEPVETKPADPEPEEKVDYAAEVCKRASLQAETRTFLDCYKWAEPLWEKLYNAMNN